MWQQCQPLHHDRRTKEDGSIVTNFSDGNERFEDTCRKTPHVPEQWPRRASAYQQTQHLPDDALNFHCSIHNKFLTSAQRRLSGSGASTDKIPAPASSSFKLFSWSVNAPPSPFILHEPDGPLPCGQELVSGPYSEADESNPCTRFLESVSTYSPIYV